MDKFMPGLAGDVRDEVLINQRGEPLVENEYCRIVRLTEGEGPRNTPATPVNNPGASYSRFVHIVDVELRLWDHRALYSVAAVNNRRGMDVLAFAVETLAEHLDRITLFGQDGGELLCDLDEQAVDQDSDTASVLGKMVVSARVITQIALCGRCDGTGRERGQDVPCNLCHGRGWESEPVRQEGSS